MQLRKLEIQNFGSVGSATIQLDIPGLILIEGVNTDNVQASSNGAGKSLPIDAICWVLWDKTPRGLGGDEVVHDQVNKDCFVRLHFDQGDTSYVVTRTRKLRGAEKANSLSLTIDGREYAGRSQQAQDALDSIINMDFQSFTALMPGLGVKVADLTDTKIKELLEQILDTAQLSKAYANARAKFKESELEVKTLTREKLSAENLITHQEKNLADLQDTLKAQETEKKAKAQQIKDRIKAIDQEIQDLQASMPAQLDLENELHDWNDQIFQAERRLERLNQDFNVAFTDFQDKIARAQSEAYKWEDMAHQITEQLKDSEKCKGSCPTCGSEVTAEHLEAHKEQLTAKQAEYLGLKQKALARHKALKESFRALKSDQDQANAEFSKARKSLVSQADIVVAAISNLQRIQNKLEGLETTKAFLQEDLQNTKKSKSNVATLVKESKAGLDQLKADLKNTEGDLAQAQRQQELYEFWVDGFSTTGIRSWLLEQVVPYLNVRANYYSGILTNGSMSLQFTTSTKLKSGLTKELFSIVVNQDKGGKSYTALSKGEKARADLIISMALGDLASLNSRSELSWRFFDESFDSIDSAGTEAVVRLLESQLDTYSTVFVITHKEALKGLFTKHLIATKADGFTTYRMDDGSYSST